jgi:comEA protein
MFRAVLPVLALACFIGIASLPIAAQDKPPARVVSTAATVAKSPININTATASELEGLPGIGARTAARIVEYRQKNGPFKKVEELMNVRGVGEKSFLRLKPQLTLGQAKTDHDR